MVNNDNLFLSIYKINIIHIIKMCFHGNCMIISENNKNYYEHTPINKFKILKNVHNYIIQSFSR